MRRAARPFDARLPERRVKWTWPVLECRCGIAAETHSRLGRASLRSVHPSEAAAKHLYSLSFADSHGCDATRFGFIIASYDKYSLINHDNVVQSRVK